MKPSFLMVSLVVAALGCSSAPVEDEGDDDDEGAIVGGDKVKAQAQPTYFSVPKSVVTPLKPTKPTFPVEWRAARQTNGALGLQVVPLKKVVQPGAARSLLSEGILKETDFVLGFRPETAETVPFMHLSMGVVSAGRAARDSIEAEFPAFHILRPRTTTNVAFWSARASRARAVAFEDVARETPMPARITLTAKQMLKGSTELGHAALVHTLVALAGCTESDIATAGEVAPCVTAGAMPSTGMVDATAVGGNFEGPLLAALVSQTPGTPIAELLRDGPNAAALTQGYRALDASLRQAGVYTALLQVLPPRLTAPSAPLPPGTEALTAPQLMPSGLLVEAMKPTRKLDYVATVIFEQ